MPLHAVGKESGDESADDHENENEYESEGELERKGKNDRSTSATGDNRDFNVVAGANLAVCG